MPKLTWEWKLLYCISWDVSEWTLLSSPVLVLCFELRPWVHSWQFCHCSPQIMCRLPPERATPSGGLMHLRYFFMNALVCLQETNRTNFLWEALGYWPRTTRCNLNIASFPWYYLWERCLWCWHSCIPCFCIWKKTPVIGFRNNLKQKQASQCRKWFFI